MVDRQLLPLIASGRSILPPSAIKLETCPVGVSRRVSCCVFAQSQIREPAKPRFTVPAHARTTAIKPLLCTSHGDLLGWRGPQTMRGRGPLERASCQSTRQQKSFTLTCPNKPKVFVNSLTFYKASYQTQSLFILILFNYKVLYNSNNGLRRGENSAPSNIYKYRLKNNERKSLFSS